MLTDVAQLVRASLRNSAGVSSIEYGILAVGVIGAVVVGVTLLSGDLSTLFTSLGTTISTAVTKVGG